jgi:hypothetical protein
MSLLIACIYIDIHFEFITWRIIMISLNLSKSLSRPLLLASAALLLHSGGALAADLAGDAQRQARDLLSGTTASPPTAVAESNVVADGGAYPSALDPQEQARQVILGTRSFGAKPRVTTAPDTKTTSPSGLVARRADADAQEQARRMILGRAG